MHRYAAFAIGVLRDIYAFHRYTTHSAYLSHTLDPQFQRLDGVEPPVGCLLYTSDAADDLIGVDLGGRGTM